MQGLNELMLLLTSRCTKSCAPFCKRDGARAVSTSRRATGHRPDVPLK